MSKAKAEIKIYDIETYPNLFVFVAKNPGDKRDYTEFVIFEDKKGDEHIDQRKELYQYLMDNAEKNIYVGYNNMAFDGPVIEEFIRRKGKMSPAQIYKFAQDLIAEEVRGAGFWEFVTMQIDLYTMWSFNTSQRRCSLKWLEFTMRMPKLKDLPHHHSKLITARQVKEVVTYCKYDVDVTENLYDLSEDKFKLRKTLYEMYGKFHFFSRGDTSLGADTFLIDLAKEMKVKTKELKKERTYYKELHLKDVILDDRLTFMTDTFKSVVDYYKGITLYPDEEGILQLGGAISHTVEFDGIKFEYGTGGLHASVDDKLIVADEDHLIIDVDVASFYPNLAISNGLHPTHLSKAFVKLYKQLYDERKQIPKSDPMNLAKKLSLNSIFGKSNSKYSYLYDSAFTLGITINGQLQLSMLAEQLARCSKLIQVNTDGVTVMVHKSQKHLIDKIIKWWEQKTDLVLEAAEYKQMAISNVNNYHAIDTDGKAKRKGAGYMIYEDITNPKMKDYHKNPSGTIIAKAINNFFMEGTPLADTVYGETNVHEFLFGFKKRSNFDFLLAKVKPNGYIDLDKNSDRVIRYYVSDNGSSIYKLTNKMGLTALNKNITTTLSQNVAKSWTTENCQDLDKEYYLDKAQELLDSLELVNNKEFVKGKIVK